MNNSFFIENLVPRIGREFLIEEANPEFYNLQELTNVVAFSKDLLALIAVDQVRGKFLIDTKDEDFDYLLWFEMALVRATDHNGEFYYYDPFDGTRNEALLILGHRLCDKLLSMVNQPSWFDLEFDADNSLWEYMDDVEGVVDYFIRCKQAVYDRLRVQRYYDEKDMKYAMECLSKIMMGSWLWGTLPVQIPVENRIRSRSGQGCQDHIFKSCNNGSQEL